MTVNTTISRSAANGDGASSTFAVPFYFLQADDLLVYVGGVLQTLTTDYAVSGAGNPAGGSITFPVAPPAGSGNVVIIRDADLLQSTKYPPNDPFPAQTHETALDKLTMLVQRARDLVGRSFGLADADTSGASLVVPAPQPSYLLGWNATGDGLANYAGIADGAAAPVPFAVSIGGTGAATAAAARANLAAAGLADDNAWTGTQTFSDAKLLIADNADASKKAAFEAAGISSGATRVLALPDKNGTLATLADLPVQLTPVPVRQAVLGGAVDANGYANWLSAGTGLTVNAAATAAPVRLAFASGYSDLVTDLAADVANPFGALAANTTSFLYADRGSATAITGGNTLVPPQYGYSFDRTRAALLHFEGANGATTTTDDWGNAWTITGGSISTAQKQFGNSSLALNGSGQYISTTAMTSLGGDSWCVEGWFRFSALPGTSTDMMLFNFANSGGSYRPMYVSLFMPASGNPQLRMFISSNGSSDDIANDVRGPAAIYSPGVWYHIALVYDALAGKYFLYKNGLLENSVTSTSRVASFSTIYIGHIATGGGVIDFNGFIDEVRISRFCPYPNGSTFTPNIIASSVIDQKVCWFDMPNMVMREVTGASVASGSNPTMAARQRMFAGEADAGTSSISAVRNYAYQAKYESQLASGAALTPIVFNHNIGADRVELYPELVCVTADNGYSPGDTIPCFVTSNGTSTFNATAGSGRNAAIFTFNGNWVIQGGKSSTSGNNLTTANWRMRMAASRRF